MKISIDHVTRIEGHANIVVNSQNGRQMEIRWEIPEAPRFFEAILRGKSWSQIAHIVSRICGICSPGHTLASLKATENAFGISPSRQTVMLRKLLSHGATIQSHALHVCFLALPDFLGAGSAIDLAGSHPETVKLALRLKKLGNDIADSVGGRAVHPISPCVGGFTKLPDESELGNLAGRLKTSLNDTEQLVALFNKVASSIPDFTRETELISLKDDREYAWIDGYIQSSDAGGIPCESYMAVVNEFVVPYSTAKRARHRRSSYMVGALARTSNNFNQLSPLAREAAAALGFVPMRCNPFMNNVAQLIETVHCVEDGIATIRALLDKGMVPEKPEVLAREGRGVGAVEVPRGILFHEYEYDKKGSIARANLVIPTNQNHANIEDDMRAWAPEMLHKKLSREEMEQNLKMLVRAYDPCISCSTHALTVKIT